MLLAASNVQSDNKKPRAPVGDNGGMALGQPGSSSQPAIINRNESSTEPEKSKALEPHNNSWWSELEASKQKLEAAILADDRVSSEKSAKDKGKALVTVPFLRESDRTLVEGRQEDVSTLPLMRVQSDHRTAPRDDNTVVRSPSISLEPTTATLVGSSNDTDDSRRPSSGVVEGSLLTSQASSIHDRSTMSANHPSHDPSTNITPASSAETHRLDLAPPAASRESRRDNDVNGSAVSHLQGTSRLSPLSPSPSTAMTGTTMQDEPEAGTPKGRRPRFLDRFQRRQR